MTSEEIDEAEIEDHQSDCAEGRHNWGPEHPTRAEKRCFDCKVIMTDEQIALIRPQPRANHLETLYEDMKPSTWGMSGTSIVYENGSPVERTRREVLLLPEQYENLKKLGKVI